MASIKIRDNRQRRIVGADIIRLHDNLAGIGRTGGGPSLATILANDRSKDRLGNTRPYRPPSSEFTRTVHKMDFRVSLTTGLANLFHKCYHEDEKLFVCAGGTGVSFPLAP